MEDGLLARAVGDSELCKHDIWRRSQLTRGLRVSGYRRTERDLGPLCSTERAEQSAVEALMNERTPRDAGKSGGDGVPVEVRDDFSCVASALRDQLK